METRRRSSESAKRTQQKKRDHYVWIVRRTGDSPEVLVINKKTGAHLTAAADFLPLESNEDIPGHNAVATVGETGYLLLHPVEEDRYLFSFGEGLFLTMRQIGSLTGIWSWKDPAADIESKQQAFIWTVDVTSEK